MIDFEKRLQERQAERDSFKPIPIYSTLSLYNKDEEVEEI